MSRRLPATFADYLVVGISPALIMLLVGSLMFFLIEVFYQGQYEARLLFVMAMFVMAIVCVARISMEEGTGYAALFGLPLAVVVGIALIRFVNFSGPLAPVSALVNWGLMALVWWAAHKLTWDCTLIDDTQDASGAGLLAQMGLDQDGTTDVAARGDVSASSQQPQLAWWQTWFEADRRPHPPGMWVVYFSLAALPLYGIGGWFVPEGDLETRRRCFWLMVVYVGSGMTLLLTTSFLGLRRYLRQRRLEMPAEMAASWVAFGGAIVLAMLLVAALLPRPSPEYSIAHLIDVKSIERQASRIAFGPDGAKSPEGAPSQGSAEPREGQPGESASQGKAEGPSQDKSEGSEGSAGGQQQGTGEDGQSESSQGESRKSQSKGSQGQGSPGQDSSSSGAGKDESPKAASGERSSEQSQAEAESSANSTEQGSDSERSQDARQSQNSGQPSPAAPDQRPAGGQSSGGVIERIVQSLGGLLKILFYLILAIVAAVLAWRYRAELLAAWQKLLAELRELWARWFGGRAGAQTEQLPAAAPPPGFSQFSDPFASGMASQWSLAELVRYTFAALEAFGREQGCPRAGGQTPLEYAAAIGSLDRDLARNVRHVAELYSQLAFAPRVGAPATLDPLRSLWLQMGSAARRPARMVGSSSTPSGPAEK